MIASPGARCWSSWRASFAAAAALAVAGCGGSWQATFQPHGAGKGQYWVVRSHGPAKAVVVLLHGLGRDSGEQLEPWQAHLAGEGYDVVYPRYPGQINPQFEPATNFKLIPQQTDIYLLVGDRDTSVGDSGALELDQRLLAFGFPAARIHGGIVRSSPGFTADHMSVYSLTKAGRSAVWGRTDRLIAQSLARAS